MAPIRYENMNYFNATQNNATVNNDTALYSTFEGFINSGSSVLPSGNYLLGWNSISEFTNNNSAHNSFNNLCVYAIGGSQLQLQRPPITNFDQIVTRGVSSCSVIHLTDGTDHLFAHFETHYSRDVSVKNEIFSFINSHGQLRLSGSFFRNDRAEELLYSISNAPNVKTQHVIGRGEKYNPNNNNSNIIHSELGISANGTDGDFFGDYFLNDGNGVLMSNGQLNDTYCFHNGSIFNFI